MQKLAEDEYYTVKDEFNKSELRIKSSRFIASAVYVQNRRIAEEHYDKLKKKYHDATHNCYAYRISDNIYRFSDDGEPSGTAGMPILRVLENQNLFETLIVVTRYFGGTKLGTGGLARAYSEAATSVIKTTTRIIKRRTTSVNLELTYDKYNDFLRMLNRFSGEISNSDFKETIKVKVEIPTSRFHQFQTEYEQLFRLN